MEMDVIDTHAHLEMPEFNDDREEVIERARSSGVNKIITIGIDIESAKKAIELAEKHSGIWAGIGIHPQLSKGVQKEDIEKLVELAGSPRVVAIGELGLDYYRDYSPRQDQMKALKWQLEAAKNLRLPVIIHCREAQEDMIPILREWSGSFQMPEGRPRGVLHCFGRDEATAGNYIEMGFYISVGGYIGYPSSARLRETLERIPLDRLVVETDCPFLPPQKYRGKRNEPAYVLHTLQALAEIKRVSVEEAARQTTGNAVRLFNL